MGAHRYATTQGETASGPRLMVLLFDAALRHARVGAAALEAGERQSATASLTKASDIVAELYATLDYDRAPELCDSLSGLYRFVCGRLTSAACTGDARAAIDAERVLTILVDAFSKAVQQAGVQS